MVICVFVLMISCRVKKLLSLAQHLRRKITNIGMICVIYTHSSTQNLSVSYILALKKIGTFRHCGLSHFYI